MKNSLLLIGILIMTATFAQIEPVQAQAAPPVVVVVPPPPPFVILPGYYWWHGHRYWRR